MNRRLAAAELAALEAELRSATQHRRAACEQLQETQRAVDALLLRARTLLDATTPASDDEPGAMPPPDPDAAPTDASPGDP
jgi:hypothetical protein